MADGFKDPAQGRGDGPDDSNLLLQLNNTDLDNMDAFSDAGLLQAIADGNLDMVDWESQFGDDRSIHSLTLEERRNLFTNFAKKKQAEKEAKEKAENDKLARLKQQLAE